MYFTTGQYEKAAEYYERALRDIKAQNGIDDNFRFIESALKKTYSHMGIEYDMESEDASEAESTQEYEPQNYSLKEISWEYYNTYVQPMISDKFGQFEDFIAVGVVGEGAESFLIDEIIDADDDVEIRICMWMKKNIFDEIGEQLNAEYDRLPDTFRGVKVRKTGESDCACGAMNMGLFFKNVLGVTSVPLSDNEWKHIEQWRLEQVTNGFVIRDTQGTFTKIRKVIASYYPDNIWL